MIIVTGDEYTRWLDTLERFLTPHITDPQRRASASVAVEGSVHALLLPGPTPTTRPRARDPRRPADLSHSSRLPW